MYTVDEENKDGVGKGWGGVGCKYIYRYNNTI